MIKLRGYQEEALNESREAFRKGAQGVCVVLPCRAGKSYIMGSMTETAKGNVLILAHRHSLIAQHKELLEKLDILKSNVRIASVFTEAKRLEQHSPDEISLIIIDEAHLSEAASYRKVCEYYHKAKRVLFTATPARLDGKPLTLAETLVVGVTAAELIEKGSISDYDYYAPDLNIDLDSVGVVAGEYNNGQVTDLMCKSAIYGDVLKYYRQLGENRQAIAYCTSVKHSEQTAAMFNANGISAVSIDGGMSIKERDARMERFKNGEVQILCNCNLISEGITIPNASVALLLRPTQSLPLFIQQACRVLTPVEGKKATIIDFVNNVQRHGLPTESHEWSLAEPVEKRKQFNEDGTLSIRQCPMCFKVFKTAPKCPFCGHEWEVRGRELQQVQAVELKKYEAEQAKKAEQERKYRRQEVGMAKTREALQEIAQRRGYDKNWVWKMCKVKGIR